MAKARYKTKQMTELHTFLQSVQGQHVTVQEIREYFKDREIAVGTTTIYRQLEKMVKEGLVEKYVVEGTNSACFEYIGESETSDYESCNHSKYNCRAANNRTYLIRSLFAQIPCDQNRDSHRKLNHYESDKIQYLASCGHCRKS